MRVRHARSFVSVGTDEQVLETGDTRDAWETAIPQDLTAGRSSGLQFRRHLSNDADLADAAA
jgi:hypothetical protein